MQRLILAVCVLTLGCGGTVDVSNGSGSTPEQQISTSLPTWCPQICAKIVQCQTRGTASTCVTDCSHDIGRQFSGHGNACAQLGLDFMNCLNNMTCTDMLNNPNACDTSASAVNVACGTGDSSATSPGVSTPDASAPPYTLVSCQSSGGLAGVGGVIPIGATVCQSNVTDCTDGNFYSVDCTYAGTNQLSCTCYRNGAMGAIFGTSGSSCPAVTVVNDNCGWHLAGI